MDDEDQIINFDEPMALDGCGSESDSSQSFPLTVQILNEELRREAMNEYGRIYNETKTIDTDKNNFKDILSKLKVSVNNENSCLSQFGINELLIMDAKNMALVSELTYELAKKFEVVEKFDTKQFLKKLKTRIIKNVIKSNLSEIDPAKRLQLVHLYPTGKASNSLHYSTPAYSRGFKTYFDPNANQHKERKATQRKLLPSGQATQPTQYDSTKSMNNVDESDKRLEHIFKSLKKLEKRNHDAVPFLQASFNPNSFAATVENVFNMAFLARQSRVIIDLDSNDIDCEPGVRTKEPDDDDNDDINNNRDDGPTRKKNMTDKDSIQSVFSFDETSYRELLEKLEITRPAIK